MTYLFRGGSGLGLGWVWVWVLQRDMQALPRVKAHVRVQEWQRSGKSEDGTE